jgi:(2S)-methylsuccinyl-CoA dehydrogenase
MPSSMPLMASPGFATYAATLRELASFAARLEAEGKLRRNRTADPADRGRRISEPFGGRHPHEPGGIRPPHGPGARAERNRGLYDLVLLDRGNTPDARKRLVELIAEGNFGASGLDDTLSEMRETMRRFVETKVAPHAHQWHLDNAYVPMEIVGNWPISASSP